MVLMKIENGQVLDYVSAFHLLRHRRNASQSEYSLLTVEILRVTLWSATVRCRRAYRKGAVVGLSAEDERGDVHSFAARVLHQASDTHNLTLRIHRTLTRRACRS